MEEKVIETVTMPDGSVMPFEECTDNLLNTRDIGVYLDTLLAMRDRYMLIMSVKDTPGRQMPDDIFNKIHSLGFSQFLKEHHRTYIGVIDRGNTLFDAHGKEVRLPIEYSADIDDIHLFIRSEYGGEGICEIIIDGEDYSLNSRGINIVVYDFETKKVVDSSTYDAWFLKATFYHKNLELDEAYFDSHIFVPKKYKEIWRSLVRRKYFSNHKLNVKEVDNGVVLPIKKINGKSHGGACSEDYKLISGHCNFSQDAHKNDRCVLDSYIPDESEVQYIDETVLYGGIHYDHLGHLIIETIANQLWYLTKISDPELKIAVIIEWGSGDGRFFRELMDAFGFPQDKIIIVSSPTKFKKLLIPDSSALMYLWVAPYEFTYEYSLFFEHIKSVIIPAKYKKIYFSKTKVGRGNFIGEEYFIEFYRKHGFEIINPEDYTLKEKAELVLGADEIVTTIGTNNLFSIFCKPSATITVLARVDNTGYLVDSLSMICEAIGCKNFYIVNVAASFLHKNLVWGLQLLSVTNEFKEYVKLVFNEEIDITPEESLKNVLYDYLKFFPEYYSEPTLFNCLKNQKMLTVLQNMSELFLGKAFDTSNLDLSTNESNLQNQVKELNAQKSSLTTQINALIEENKALKSTNAQNETELAWLHTNQNKSNAELLDAHRQKDEADKKLLDAAEEKITLIADISVKNHQIDTLIFEKDKLAASVSAKESELLIATDKVQALEYECAELKNKISWMENTRSWRYTKPFRKKKKGS